VRLHKPISNQTLGLEVEAFLDTLDHQFGGTGLCRAGNRRRLHIEDDTVVGVNQVVG
jgi:hypothetical protein